MKTTIKLILLCSLFMVTKNVSAQAPEGVNYQATVRNSSGSLMTNQSIAVIFAIKKTTAAGTIVYQESQTLTTNNYGGFAAIIGQGTATTGTFTAIDWANNSHFVNVKVNGNDLGTSKLQSVPYALHAKTAAIAKKLENPIWKKRVSNGDFFTVGQPIIIGDSSQNASKLTIVENSPSSEMIDLIKTNSVGGNDVINMSVTTTGIGQYLECATNGNNKFSLNTNGTMNIDSTIKIDDGEINRTSTGSANMVPVAYGTIQGTGVKYTNTTTSNVTSTKVSTGVYDITITGETFSYINYAVSVSKIGTGYVHYSSTSGKLRIYTRNTSNTLTDGYFSFIVYKP